MLFKPRALSDMLIPATGRGVAVGTTGSGKTTLAEFLCARFENVACLDPKGLLSWQGYKKFTTLKELVNYANSRPKVRVIYSPNALELHNEEYIEAFFRWVYERRNTFCYIDEVYAVTSPTYIPFSYKALLTRGRERGNGVLSSTQRPMLIPSFIMSESENWYVFRLSMPQDKKKVWETIAIDPDLIGKLPKRYFLFCKADEDLRTSPLTLNLKEKKSA